MRLTYTTRLRALSASTAVTALFALACAGRPAGRTPEIPPAKDSTSAVTPRAASTSSASAKPPARVTKASDPPPLGKPGGRLAPEIIQRVVRASFGRFRLCYENSLRNCPNLQGRVAVRFIIDIDGSVKQPRDAGSDGLDPGVSACVAESFREIRFPPPEGGTVTVTYPIVFAPGG